MSATTILREDLTVRELHGADGFGRRALGHNHHDAAIAGLADRDRIRDLAAFLEFDRHALAAGLLEAVEQDPVLRIRRL